MDGNKPKIALRPKQIEELEQSLAQIAMEFK